MRDLFLCEVRRFRNAALIAAGVHLAILVFLCRLFDFLQFGWHEHLLALVFYLLAGLAFSMFQFGSYRQPSRWLWLMHRPLGRPAIFGAIMLASTCLIVFAIGLPALLTVGFLDHLTAHVVDTRHYVMVLHMVLLTLAAWSAGSYVVISDRKTAIVVLVLPLLVVVNLASSFVLIVPAVACVALLAWIAYGAFKPDRRAAPRRLALAATALPLQIGFYLVMVWGFSITFQGLQMLAGTSPINSPVAPAGGYTESTRSDGRTLFLRGLAGATDPRAEQWRRQIALLDIAKIEPTFRQFFVRNQASNLAANKFTNPEQHTNYAFSHDTMRYEGRNAMTGQPGVPLGSSGPGDSTPFNEVPVLPGAPYFVSPHTLYGVASDQLKPYPLIHVSAPETLVREPKQVGELLYVLTNERLIAYLRPAPGAPAAMLRAKFSVYLPQPFSDLDRADVATLPGGTLVSFSFGRGMAGGAGDATQTILLVGPEGQARLVAQRRLAHDFPAVFEHLDWWLSPVLHTVLALPDALLDKGMVLDRDKGLYSNELEEVRPAAAWLAALLAAGLSGLYAAWWLQRAPLGLERKIGWIAGCVLLGPPALASLMVLQPQRHKSALKVDAGAVALTV